MRPAGIESHIARDGIAAISAADEVPFRVIPARESKVIIVMRRPVAGSIKLISGICRINKLVPNRIQPVEITAVGVESDRADSRVLGIEDHVGRGRDLCRVIDDRSVCKGPILELAAIGSGDPRRAVINIASVREGIGYFGKIRIPVKVSAVGVEGDLVAVRPAGIKSHVAGDGYAVVSAADEVLVCVIPTRERHVIVVGSRLIIPSRELISGSNLKRVL